MSHPPGTICVISGELSRYPAFSMSLMGMHSPPGTSMTWQTGNAIAANRNRCVREMSGEWIWFIDDDHVWDRDLLMRLLDHHVDIVGPVYAMRYHPFPPSIFNCPDGQGGFTAMSWDVLNYPGLMNVFAIGTAGMLIRKPVFEALRDPWFEVGRTSPEGLWEDAWFCQKARQAGFGIHVDTTLTMGHISRSVLWPGVHGVEAEIAESGIRVTVPTQENMTT